MTLENRIFLLEADMREQKSKSGDYESKLGRLEGSLESYQTTTNTALEDIRRQVREGIDQVKKLVESFGNESSEGISNLYKQFGFDKDPNMGYNFQQMVKHHQDATKINEEDKRYYKRLIIGTVVVAVIMASFSVAGIAYNAYSNGQTAKVVQEMKDK